MTWLCNRGHIASARDLAAMGVSRRAVGGAVAEGRLIRCRRGTYACAHIDTHEGIAAAVGGRIDCVSALARHENVWTGPLARELHLRVDPRFHADATAGAVLHWRVAHGESGQPLEVAPIDALLQAMTCLSRYDALAAVESAVHLGYLGETDLGRLTKLAPQRMRVILKRLDVRSQSGLETFTRLQLQDAGHRVECQVPIPGAGVLDLLVDDCVGIETDGEKWHANRFHADRTKDVLIEAWGIRVLRIGRPHIFDEWPTTLAAIERMVAESAPRLRAQLRGFS
ncbi:MAG: type IV toxin-antitoxin system AbiEi family antitoxin domain-containing protein [Actinobacteria bacterium]|nr:type IV toxin-antitoxin system AbiEi family antitoxin domain-containing protein [Actinomycetota bacterium]